MTTPMTTKEDVEEALRLVIDPEIGINIVDLGLVYGIEVDEDHLKVTYTLTSMGCPAGPMIDSDIRGAIATVSDVKDIQTEVVMEPPWTPDKMSDFAKSALGFF